MTLGEFDLGHFAPPEPKTADDFINTRADENTRAAIEHWINYWNNAAYRGTLDKKQRAMDEAWKLCRLLDQFR